MLYCSELRNIEPFFSLDKVCDKLIPPHMAIQCTEVISPITNQCSISHLTVRKLSRRQTVQNSQTLQKEKYDCDDCNF